MAQAVCCMGVARLRDRTPSWAGKRATVVFRNQTKDILESASDVAIKPCASDNAKLVDAKKYWDVVCLEMISRRQVADADFPRAAGSARHLSGAIFPVKMDRAVARGHRLFIGTKAVLFAVGLEPNVLVICHKVDVWRLQASHVTVKSIGLADGRRCFAGLPVFSATIVMW